MVILSGPIFKRCYDVLNRCDIFEPEQKATLENALTAVGLDNHQYDHASNRPGQVHNIINYLLKQDVKEGKPVFWIFLDGLWRYGFLQENTSLYKDVKECCALIEIGYALQIDARVANKYDVNHIVKLVEYFFKYPILDDSDQCRQVMLQLPIEIRQKINQNGRNTATTSGVAILKASICFPDGPGKLASILYESEHESARWRELDELLRELYQTNVTYTRLQQLQSLLKPIELSNDILMDFYRASTPAAEDILDNAQQTLMQTVLDNLAILLPDPDGVYPILAFVACISAYVMAEHGPESNADLNDWIRRRAGELKVNAYQYINSQNQQPQVSRNQPIRASYLLIALNTQNGHEFAIQACLMDAQNKILDNAGSYVSDKLVNLEELPRQIDEIRKNYVYYLSKDVIVEIFLPTHLLCHTVEHWPIDIGMGAQTKFGIKYRLVVRSVERACNLMMRSDWEDKWELFQTFIRGEMLEKKQTHAIEGPIWLCEEEECKKRSQQDLYSALYGSQVVCFAMNFAPQPAEPPYVLRTMLLAGIPIALWPGPLMKHLDDCFADIREKLFQENHHTSSLRLQDLPDWVWEQRMQTKDDEHCLTLFWDNPDRVLPGMPQFLKERGGINMARQLRYGRASRN